MAILNRISVVLLYCASTHFLLLAAEFQARESGNRAIRDSRFSAAKVKIVHLLRRPKILLGSRDSSHVCVFFLSLRFRQFAHHHHPPQSTVR